MDFPGTPVMGKSVIDVSLARNEVTWKVPEIGIDFAGQLSGNSIRGVNKNGKYEVNLIKGKYQPGIFDMPPEEIRRLAGQWVGKWDVPGETVYSILLRFDKTKDEKLEASFNIPLRGQQLVAALEDVSLKGDQLSFWIPKMWNGNNTEYTGKLNNGSISGTFAFRGKKYAVNLNRGAKFEVPTTQVNIPAKKIEKLLGRWSGKVSPVSFVLRFERNADGKYVAFIDDTKTNSKTYKGLMVIKASMDGANLSMKTPFGGSEINGKLNFFGNRMNGTVKVMEADSHPRYLTTPLSLAKE